MKVSLNWVRLQNDNYNCSNNSELKDVDRLIEKIGSQLGAVEEVIDLGKKYQSLLVVKVVNCIKHPNADKLSFCLIDDGRTDKKVARNSDGLIEVVCGAPNVKAGQLVVWIPPGATVPSSYDKEPKEPFVIEARDIRGKTSNGMLASPKELDLFDEHEGILLLDNGKPGEPFAKQLYLDDFIIDIENKMFTHRPDCFGILGIARELAGINGKPFKSPDWYSEDASLLSDARKNVLKLSVKNDSPELVPRFCAVVIKDVKVAPSPVWLQSFLSRSGIRPINNIVDITNWFMLATAQPLHAYDYDKVKTGVLGVRLGKKGEQLNLLNGKTIKIDHEAIIITDGERPIGLGGVMGGADTEVDENTKNIILECANFDMNATRRTAMAYGLFTDAATRFTKNQSPRQNLAVLVKTANDTLRLVGGRIASPIVDDKNFKASDITIKTSTSFINSRLGLKLLAADIKKLLQNVEFKVEGTQELSITVPFWRTDIEIPEDIVEEVGRLYGYDHLPLKLPQKDLKPAVKEVPLEFKRQLRDLLVRAGANEVLTYSFVHERLLKAAGQDPSQAYHIRNAVSPDLQYYRLSLTPSLLDKVHANRKNGFDAFAMFEIGKAHTKGFLDHEGLPAEAESLSAVTVNPYLKGAAYYQARRLADYLFDMLNIEQRSFQLLGSSDAKLDASSYKGYEPLRSALISANKRVIGIIGEPTQKLAAALKLPAGTAMFELDIPNLYESQLKLNYRSINRYPSSIQDICLKLPAKIEYGSADQLVWDELERIAAQDGYKYEMETLDIFQRPDDTKYHQITWRITLSHPDKTLTTQNVNQVLDMITNKAKKEFNAERI